MRPGCVFCEVLAGKAPASFVFEGDRAAAFLDLFPVHPGHTLVVPKAHAEDLISCPAELAAHVFEVSARLAPAIVAATGAEGFNIWTANGSAAGQEIFHLHLHVLPRFERDAFGLRFPKDYPREATRSELDDIATRIRSMMERGSGRSSFHG